MDITVKQTAKSWSLHCGNRSWPCAIGKNGTVHPDQKVEGDGKTPVGSWKVRSLLFRADRITQEERSSFIDNLVCSPLSQRDGWCDDPQDAYYNRPVIIPYDAGHELLWRDQENVYDLIIILGYNDDPVVKGKGSAIFLHIAKPGLTPTEGCIALARDHLLELLPLITDNSSLHVVIDGVQQD